nr:ankyrin repeat domain-containing protein [Thalassotalea sp. Y01]
MLAANVNDLETVNTLLQNKATNMNAIDITGRTALHSAVAANSIECVKAILATPIDTKIQNIDGATALHTAVKLGYEDIAIELIKHSPELLTIKDKYDGTPIDILKFICTNKDFYERQKIQLIEHRRYIVDYDVYSSLLKSLNKT